jgi:O-acetyl-ADP-ribose deacetylase (regulator of RNase III)
MALKYIQGDLFETKDDIIAHGCNCRGGFGAGIAGIIARKFPKARAYYMDKHEEDGWKLGDIQPVEQWTGQYIVNCATQDNYAYSGVLNADYNAIRLAMTRLKEFAKSKSFTISIPKIGAGLAGGDWNIIEKILEEVFSDYDITIYYL